MQKVLASSFITGKLNIMHEHALHNNDNPNFYYCFDDAVEVIFSQLPNNIRFKYTWEDVMLILELKDEYYDLCAANLSKDTVCDFPIEIEEEDLRRHIIYHAKHNDLQLPEADLIEILDAELAYFEQNGSLRDAGEWLN